MENINQKYIKYFYVVLILIIFIQMCMIIATVLIKGVYLETFLIMLLSVVNILELINTIRFNVKQRFTECKMSLKVLRITVVPLMLCQALFCFTQSFNWIMLMDYIGTLILVEIVLSYRIKCINHLETLANKIIKME